MMKAIWYELIEHSKQINFLLTFIAAISAKETGASPPPRAISVVLLMMIELEHNFSGLTSGVCIC